MNKKLLIGIIAGVVALVLAVGAIIGFSTGLFSFEKSGGGSKKEEGIAGESSNVLESSSTTEIKKGEVQIKSAEGTVDDVVALPITIDENPGMAAGQMFFLYDSSALAYEGYAEGEIFDEYTVEDMGDKVGCVLSLKDISENTTKNGTLLTLKFSIRKGAQKGEYKVELSENTMFADIDENTVTPKISSGVIKVR